MQEGFSAMGLACIVQSSFQCTDVSTDWLNIDASF